MPVRSFFRYERSRLRGRQRGSGETKESFRIWWPSIGGLEAELFRFRSCRSISLPLLETAVEANVASANQVRAALAEFDVRRTRRRGYPYRD